MLLRVTFGRPKTTSQLELALPSGRWHGSTVMGTVLKSNAVEYCDKRISYLDVLRRDWILADAVRSHPVCSAQGTDEVLGNSSTQQLRHAIAHQGGRPRSSPNRA